VLPNHSRGSLHLVPSIPFRSSEFHPEQKENFLIGDSGMALALLTGIAANCEAQSWRWSMKIQRMIRVQLMLLGLGAGLFMAKPVCAQQDTDPTLFEAPADASQPNQAALNVAPSPEPVIRVTAYAYPVAPSSTQEADMEQLTALDINTVLTLLVGIGSIVLLGVAEVVRGSRRRTWREKAADDFPMGALAN
jgi:hypothetical protein